MKKDESTIAVALRPPVVAVLGHVDHGKTTLLDVIRKTNVVSHEAGGITQGTGASMITLKDGKRITFIDTPGHAAFSAMRSRGARVADIAILVVAADDGVKPQTKEALEMIRNAGVPFVVALTKTDLPSADIESAKGQLEKEGILFEGRGGDVPVVALSAKKEEGIEGLLDTISLLAEVIGLKGSVNDPLEAVVIETAKDNRGLLVSAVVKSGKLSVGQVVYTEGIETKIRGLFDFQLETVKEILSGEPTQILGFSQLPSVGSVISTTKQESSGVVLGFQATIRDRFQKEGLIVSIKAQTKGSLEALVASLPEGVVVTEASVGDVSENDVLMAKTSGARIFAFESKASSAIIKLADAEGVKIEKFDIIYKLLDRIGEIIKEGDIEILGKAEIIAKFPFNNKQVAGCRVASGKIKKNDSLILMRGEKELGKVKANSIKKQKLEVKEVGAGEEFGVLFEPQLDFEVGDVIVSVANG